MTPGLWPDPWVLLALLILPLLVLGTTTAVSAWRERHPPNTPTGEQP
ncbi:hypothetical protein [Kitasatospora sp. McL0602]